MSVERNIRYELLARLCPNSTEFELSKIILNYCIQSNQQVISTVLKKALLYTLHQIWHTKPILKRSLYVPRNITAQKRRSKNIRTIVQCVQVPTASKTVRYKDDITFTATEGMYELSTDDKKDHLENASLTHSFYCMILLGKSAVVSDLLSFSPM
uniref:Uncharacterized protein n=1 Tax=Romanomermis culicivorax TaxID=13658 RepID=A0A915J6Y8_ROMCU